MWNRKPFYMKQFILLALIMVMVVTGVTSFKFYSSSQARSIVEKFYSYEQAGNFSDSWELFHPFMKKKFPKASCIQDRAHVFIGHFGAETFKYEVGNATKVENWRAAKDQPLFKRAYQFDVTQFYQGKYGKFSFKQEVYVVKHKEEWTIIWNYNK
jgi:hypothetical protein